ncbi:DUF5606 domain-containing protein [Olivibacter sp. CPCC 100613]|uniref:DUF5606 family protein n=1 Tax=Olivibacter sp. CPCC 100613 TaxID=3079931 RepID=UPI002FF4A72D
MNLRGIVSVTGRPGLFKLIGQNKTGFILESLDEKRVKIVVNISTAKMASLEDITIFGTEDDIKLIDIFEKMKQLSSLPDTKKDSGDKLRVFFQDVAPDHDEERVYSSDIKKIISWFGILKEFPLFDEEAPAPLSTGAADNAKEPEGEELAK